MAPPARGKEGWMGETRLLHEYTEILLGMRKAFSAELFSGNEESNQRTALQVVRYATEIFLHCRDPRAIGVALSPEAIKKMKLARVMGYIHFPEELDRNRDFFYIAHLLYPRAVPYDEKDLSLKVYKDILSGKLHKFPKKYLDGGGGRRRACYCMAHMVSSCLSLPSTEALYRFFSGPEGTEAIRKYKLKQASIDLFETPVDFLHASLPAGQADGFWLLFYKFRVMQARADRKAVLIEKEKERREAARPGADAGKAAPRT